MRLTNIAQLDLPHGQLSSFTVHVSERLGQALPVSFDQAIHVEKGDRPGSWMAIAFRMPDDTALDHLASAWLAVVARHGTFRTVFTEDGAGVVDLHSVEIAGSEWRQHPIESGHTVAEVLRHVLDEACTPFHRPSHALCVVNPDAEGSGATESEQVDTRPIIVIASDHAHVDMWSLAVVVRDFASFVADAAAGRPLDTRLDAGTAPTFAEHTERLAQLPPAPAHVVQRWDELLAAGDQQLPRFPLPLGDVSEPRAEVVEVRDILTPVEVTRLEQRAARDEVRPTALAISVLTEVTERLAGVPLRAVFPVHSRYDRHWHDSVGWFITNSVLECRDSAPSACAAAIKDALVLGSFPLAPIFASRGGWPATPGMFAISWLDMRRLPRIDGDAQIQFVSAALRTDGVMVWFALDDSGMHLRCRYPETPEARINVGAWLDAVVEGIRGAAR